MVWGKLIAALEGGSKSKHKAEDGMLCYVVSQKLTNVSEVLTASIIIIIITALMMKVVKPHSH
jgi:hypothetical protein